jgi:hypothetical protein
VEGYRPQAEGQPAELGKWLSFFFLCFLQQWGNQYVILKIIFANELKISNCLISWGIGALKGKPAANPQQLWVLGKPLSQAASHPLIFQLSPPLPRTLVKRYPVKYCLYPECAAEFRKFDMFPLKKGNPPLI